MMMLRRMLRTWAVTIACAAAVAGCSREATPPEQEQQPPPQAPLQSGSLVITGLVFEDANRNGQFDEGEARLAGRTVTLGHPSGEVEQSTDSAPDGTFRFDDVPEGSHRVTFQAPAGYERTTDDSLVITLRTGAPVPEVRFGIAPAR